MPATNAELTRLEEDRQRTAYWRRWGPYLSERQWGTVREDYSATGEAWDYFPHDHARSRVYRWGEDGLLGISDNHQRLCFALALWNERDPILKERMFGLAGGEGNHGEDVKEYYFYLDATPSHSYLKGLYKYPQAAFPYEQLIEENRRRGIEAPEYELLDTGVFDGDRYFDVSVEYAKAAPDDFCIRITATNCGPDPAPLHLLPTLWFRNTWDFGDREGRPGLSLLATDEEIAIRADHPALGAMVLAGRSAEVLFTDNETNFQRVFGSANSTAFQKDGIGRYLVNGEKRAVNPAQTGTKAAFHHAPTLGPGETFEIKLRLTSQVQGTGGWLGADFDEVIAARRREADEFYGALAPTTLDADLASVQRQAFAGMLWNKQFYHYVVERWLDGDPGQPTPPAARLEGRNSDWRHLFNDDILSLPDTWEFPWFASWDLAFHCLPLALVDPEFAKRQLMLLTREWYMHPNGQLPAYEWNFGDVNPPVHAWGAWRVYTIERKMKGSGGAPAEGDRQFLERVFQKLLLNFTWWVNRKDEQGRNIFQGGFLGLDNIGVFDRSQPLPTGGYLEQSDGTSWMAMYALNLLKIALELAQYNPVYEDIASKFFEHFLSIASAMNATGDRQASLWDEEDGLFYDHIHLPSGDEVPLKIHSMVSLIPLFAVETIDLELLDKLPGFKRRFQWFMEHRPALTGSISRHCKEDRGGKLMLSLVDENRLRRVLTRLLDEGEFLGPYGVRSLSKYHEAHPYVFQADGTTRTVDYNPGESRSGLFGGNSNWRGPVWMPVNYLLIESLQKFHYYLGDEYKVECPTGSGQMMTLWEVAAEISRRLVGIFRRDEESGRRPVFGPYEKFQTDPGWNAYPFFHEYFHADEGRGCGASHQTGWTGLIAKVLQQTGEYGLLDGENGPEKR